MLKTRVPLVNISRVLLNQKVSICDVQRPPPPLPPNIHAVDIHSLSLVHQVRLFLALTFVALP